MQKLTDEQVEEIFAELHKFFCEVQSAEVMIRKVARRYGWDSNSNIDAMLVLANNGIDVAGVCRRCS